jgi:CubicO group peptidase (beta-lactamase class C family)
MDDLTDLLHSIKNPDVPSIAAAAIVDGELRAAGVVGQRKRGSDVNVELNDKYHLGSCGKSMTATLAAIAVEEGRLSWDTRVSDVFKDIAIHEGYHPTTLHHLLSHQGGCSANPEDKLWEKLCEATGSPSEQRMQLVRGVLSQAPQYPPGQGSEYSNSGYAIAGAMLEQTFGEPYEQLLTERLFHPLKMDSAGFAAPSTPGKLDQPLGHNPDPIEPGPGADNPAAVAPAGTMHCSILDFAKYAHFHLTGQPKSLLSKKSLEMLHDPMNKEMEYALGWTVTEREWAHGRALTHAGSNTMFYAVMWLAPKRKFAVVTACNLGTEETFWQCDQVISRIVKKYLSIGSA